MKKKYNQIKNAEKRKFKINERNQMSNLGKTNPKEFWKKIKSQYKLNTKTSESLDVDNLYTHINQLYNIDAERKDHSNEDNNKDSDIQAEHLDNSITIHELKDAIFPQDNNKSPGMADIIAEIYKHSFENTSMFIFKLFNRLYENGDPKLWGKGVIIPTFKGGNIDDVKNYRGVTLINILGKTTEQINKTVNQT